MTGDRSLEEFIGGGGGAVDSQDEDSGADPGGADGAGAQPGDPGTAEDHEEAGPKEAEPIVTTRAWSPGGAACEGCGTVVEERWRSADGLVCDACKEW